MIKPKGERWRVVLPAAANAISGIIADLYPGIKELK